MIEKIMNDMFKWYINAAMDLVSEVLIFTSEITDGIWQNPLTLMLLRMGRFVGLIIFGLSVVMLIFDTIEDVGSNKKVATATILTNFLKGLLFCEIAPRLAVVSISMGNQILRVFKLNINLAESSNFVDTFASRFSTLLASLVMIIVLIIGVCFFFYQSLKRFGTMLIQILMVPIYVPGIVRGDTTAMGSWIRQAVAITLTFLFQYILFYFGISLFLTNETLGGLSCWIGMGAVGKMLDKYGLSVGTGGGLSSAASMAMQGIQMIAK